MEKFAAPAGAASQTLLRQAMDRLSLSMRAYHRILKVARSIANLEGVEGLETHYVSEAISLCRLDRSMPGDSFST